MRVLYTLRTFDDVYVCTISVVGRKVEFTDIEVVVTPKADVIILDGRIALRASIVTSPRITYGVELYDLGSRLVRTREYEKKRIYAGLLINVAQNYRNDIHENSE